MRPILQNLKGRSVLDKFFFENDPLDELNQMPLSKKCYLLSKLVKNAKWWSKSNLPLSHSTAKFFPLKKGFKKPRKPEQINARCPVCIVIFKNKYDYANETANIHLLRLFLFFCVYVFDSISQYFPETQFFAKNFLR